MGGPPKAEWTDAPFPAGGQGRVVRMRQRLRSPCAPADHEATRQPTISAFCRLLSGMAVMPGVVLNDW